MQHFRERKNILGIQYSMICCDPGTFSLNSLYIVPLKLVQICCANLSPLISDKLDPIIFVFPANEKISLAWLPNRFANIFASRNNLPNSTNMQMRLTNLRNVHWRYILNTLLSIRTEHTYCTYVVVLFTSFWLGWI